MASQYVDLSHRIEHEMVTYPGLPGPVISTYLSRAESAQRLGSGVSFHIGRIEMVANTGTYLDAPHHFHAEGADVAELALERLVEVPAVVIRARDRTAIGPEVLGDPDPARPVHHTVLAHGIPLIEHLTNLDRLPDQGARLTARPAPVRGLSSFPVRAVGVLPHPG